MRSPENSTRERERERRGFRLCFFATAALEEGRSPEVAGCVGGQQQVGARGTTLLGFVVSGGHAKKKRGGMPLSFKPEQLLNFGKNTPSPLQMLPLDKITPNP